MSLCLECGLCCDGSLFVHASLDGGGPRTSKLNAATDKPGFFTQPCVALDGCACTIYEDRPSACRAFACSALRALDAGRYTYAQALAEIGEIKTLRAGIAEAAGLPDSGATVRHVARLPPEQTSYELREAVFRYGTRLQLFIAKP